MTAAISVRYFTSATCVPCKKFLPVVKAAAEEYSAPLEVVSIDSSEGAEQARSLGVLSVPQAFIYHNGRVIDRFGVITRRQLATKIESFLNGV